MFTYLILMGSNILSLIWFYLDEKRDNIKTVYNGIKTINNIVIGSNIVQENDIN